MFDELFTKYEEIFKKIAVHFGCKSNSVSNSIKIVKLFNEGLSGDTVLLIRVVDPGLVENAGDYVLKVFSDSARAAKETENTSAASQWNPMRHIHIPELRFAGPGFYMYDVAGEELENAASLAKCQEIPRSNRLGEVSSYLLEEWNENPTTAEKTIYDLLREWLDWRLEEDSELFTRVRTLISDDLASSFVFENQQYPNPLFYLASPESPLHTHDQATILALYGQTHGDLNLNNVISQKRSDNSNDYFLIDFAQYKKQTPLLLDQSYILFCSLLDAFEAPDLVSWKDVVNTFFDNLNGEMELPREIENTPPYYYIKAQMAKLKTYEMHQQKHNRRAFRLQLLTSHVAVGMNFVNKRALGIRQRQMALLYAAAALNQLLCRLGIEMTPDPNAPQLEDPDAHNHDLWQKVEQFSKDNRYILITTGVDQYVSYACMNNLSLVQWSMIIEINHYMNNELRTRVMPAYKKNQGYRFYSLPSQDIHVAEAAPAWVHLDMQSDVRNPGLYYRKDIQNKLGIILQKILLNRQNEPLIVVADLNGIHEKIYDPLIEDILVHAGENTPSRIVALDNHSIAIDSDSHIQAITTHGTLQELSDALYTLRGSNFQQNDPKIPSIEGMTPLPMEILSNIRNDMELVYMSMIYDMQDDAGDSFYRGGPATWCDIASNRDVERCDYMKEWKGQLRSKLEQQSNGAGTMIHLFHRPGGGGTTLSKRIAWDFCSTFPTVILKRVSPQTAERLKLLYSLTKKTILVVVEISDGNISDETIGKLRRDLINKNIRVLFLCVSRFIGAGRRTESSFYLPETIGMSYEDAVNMLERYTARLDHLYGEEDEIERRKRALRRFTLEEEFENIRHPFFYGLYTYEKDFLGIEPYVKNNICNVEGHEIITLEVLSLITIYSQSINLTYTETALFLYPGVDPHEMNDIVKEWAYNNPLVIPLGRGVRICHPIIAEELLYLEDILQKESNSNQYSGTDLLNDLAIRFIDTLVKYYGNESERLNSIFREIFTHRDTVYEDEQMKFSQFLTALRTRERGVRLLEHLIDVVPWNPHYNNHLARLYIYPISEDQSDFELLPKEALKHAKEAIKKAESSDTQSASIHYHVLGKVYIKQCLKELDKIDRAKSPNQMLKSIKSSYDLAWDAFDHCLVYDNTGYGLTGKLELITCVLQRITKKKHANIANIMAGKSGGDSRAVAKMISEACDLIGAFISKFDVYSTAFRTTCIRFYGTIGNSERIELLFKSDATSLSDILYANRAISAIQMRSGFNDGSFSYSRLSQSKLEMIYQLMEENIKTNRESEQDRIRWFEAYRRIQNFDMERAYQFLKDWPDGDNNMFVCYYRYVIAFILFSRTGNVSYSEWKAHWRQTLMLAQRSYGKNITASLNFFSNAEDVNGCLLPWADLDFDVEETKNTRIEKNRVFRRDKCKEFSGIIESIEDNVITIRFTCEKDDQNYFYAKTPNVDQIPVSKEGSPVSFFLGFSYSGFRAWDVEDITISDS